MNHDIPLYIPSEHTVDTCSNISATNRSIPSPCERRASEVQAVFRFTLLRN